MSTMLISVWGSVKAKYLKNNFSLAELKQKRPIHLGELNSLHVFHGFLVFNSNFALEIIIWSCGEFCSLQSASGYQIFRWSIYTFGLPDCRMLSLHIACGTTDETESSTAPAKYIQFIFSRNSFVPICCSFWMFGKCRIFFCWTYQLFWF